MDSINWLRITLGLVALTCSTFASAQQKSSEPNSAMALTTTTGSQQIPTLQPRNPRYQVELSDVVVLNFPLTPEYNETAIVQPDGYINLVGLDDIHILGQTLPELQQSIRSAYTKVLHEPVLYVSLQSFVTPSFSAYGEVGKPGKYDLHGDTTVSQAVAIAGGFTDKAKHSQVLLFRRVSNDMLEAKKVNLKHMLKSGNMAEDLHLQPGDIVFIPKNVISKVQPFIPWSAFRVGYAIPNN